MSEPESVGVSSARILFALSPAVQVAFRFMLRGGISVALYSGGDKAFILPCCHCRREPEREWSTYTLPMILYVSYLCVCARGATRILARLLFHARSSDSPPGQSKVPTGYKELRTTNKTS